MVKQWEMVFILLIVGDSYFHKTWHSSIVVNALQTLESIRDLGYNETIWVSDSHYTKCLVLVCPLYLPRPIGDPTQ